MYKIGSVQKKILVVLLGGTALGLSHSPQQYFRTLRAIKREWREINQQNFNRSISRLTQEKLLEEKRLANGSFKLVLTKEGREQARKLSLLGSSIKFKKSKYWDKKWRIVIFDIPEKDRGFRDVLRNHLRELDFKKLQHSVFVSPYAFERSILKLVRLYQSEKYVRVITAIKIDNENKLKRYFFKKNKTLKQS